MCHVWLVSGRSAIALAPVLVLLAMGGAAAVYLRRSVRPSFLFPEGSSRRDESGLFFAGGFDPETKRTARAQWGH